MARFTTGARGFGATLLFMLAAAMPHAAEATVTFVETLQVDHWTVPVSGQYQISAWGGQGGQGAPGQEGGLGALIAGAFDLNAGETLDIVVGAAGGDGQMFSPGFSGSGGGGGGSFVYLHDIGEDADPLVIAGGGGGAGALSEDHSEFDGRHGQDGGAGSNNQVGTGGQYGAGGMGGGSLFNIENVLTPIGGGGGGAGLLYAGLTGGQPHGGAGGSTPAEGYAGGAPDAPNVSGAGGFGGGGGGSFHGGGGGGGYSGGGGGSAGSLDFFRTYTVGGYGGGGGSFVATYGVPSYNLTSTRAGDGLVEIDYLPPATPPTPPVSPAPEPVTWALMLVGVAAVGGRARWLRRNSPSTVDLHRNASRCLS